MKIDNRKWRRWAAVAGAALALAACGGGGGIDGTGNDNGGVGAGNGGIDGTGMSYGTITAFGSVWVNGVRFNTDAVKNIVIDDKGGFAQADLRVGMVVRVEGSIGDSASSANVITVDDAVKGYVESVAADGTGIVVMGQTVVYDNLTRFDNGVRPAAGDYVEVHGLAVRAGTLAAGYVQRKATPADPPFVVKGLVSAHDATARTFTVGNLTVAYTGATTGDMPTSGSWAGLLVEAKGSSCAGRPVCATLTASKVEPAGARLSGVSSLAKAEVEGFVASGSSASFTIGGQKVVTSASTVYRGGTAADVLVGTKLEAEGPVSNGVIQATKVSFKDSIEFEANVATVSANGNTGTLTLSGLPGVQVQVNGLTERKDGVQLGSLLAGYNLRIKARPGADGTVLAIKLELKDTRPDNRLILQGPVSAVSGTSSATILGVTVDNGAVSEFRNLDDSAMSRAAFYAAIVPGSTIVKARASLSGSTPAWNQMELED